MKLNLTNEYALKLKEINTQMTQPVMAKKLGVSMRTICNWLNDAGVIKLTNAEKIDQVHKSLTV